MARVKLNRPVTVRLDGHRVLTLARGVSDVPAEFAGHWYLKAAVKAYGEWLTDAPKAPDDTDTTDDPKTDGKVDDKKTVTGKPASKVVDQKADGKTKADPKTAGNKPK